MFGLTYEEELLLNERIAQGMLLVSLPVFVLLRYFVPSPWGKTLISPTRQARLGPLLLPRLSWFLFESPNLIWSFVCWKERRRNLEASNQILLCLFFIHYTQRAILYPLILSKNTKRMPFEVVASAFVYCNVNGYLQAQSLCQFQFYSEDWIYSPQCLLGIVLFFTGMAINCHSDAILRKLRRASSTYQIPKGGLFAYVSEPHYFGEMLEWFGFAVACNYSTPSCAFLVFTACNLIPRAIAHHAWYQTVFADSYPAKRKAVIPFIW